MREKTARLARLNKELETGPNERGEEESEPERDENADASEQENRDERDDDMDIEPDDTDFETECEPEENTEFRPENIPENTRPEDVRTPKPDSGKKPSIRDELRGYAPPPARVAAPPDRNRPGVML